MGTGIHEKECTACGNVKVSTEFYSGAARCKECVKAAVRARYREKRDDMVAYERERTQRPERRQKAMGYMRKMRREHPENYKARTAVGNAVRDGRLIRKPCEVCGEIKVQAHHEDYSRPLDVHWLCFRCHREHAHGQVVTSGAPANDLSAPDSKRVA